MHVGQITFFLFIGG